MFHHHQRLGFLALAPPPLVQLSPLRLHILIELWCRSDIIHAPMESLVKRGLPPARTEALEWVVPSDEEAPAPLDGYIVSFIPFHERGLVVMRTSSTITRWQRRNKKRPSGLVVVGRRPCEPLNNPTCLAWEEEATLKERATLPLSD
jgi:hypothetical protein